VNGDQGFCIAFNCIPKMGSEPLLIPTLPSGVICCLNSCSAGAVECQFSMAAIACLLRCDAGFFYLQVQITLEHHHCVKNKQNALERPSIATHEVSWMHGYISFAYQLLLHVCQAGNSQSCANGCYDRNDKAAETARCYA